MSRLPSGDGSELPDQSFHSCPFRPRSATMAVSEVSPLSMPEQALPRSPLLPICQKPGTACRSGVWLDCGFCRSGKPIECAVDVWRCVWLLPHVPDCRLLNASLWAPNPYPQTQKAPQTFPSGGQGLPDCWAIAYFLGLLAFGVRLAFGAVSAFGGSGVVNTAGSTSLRPVRASWAIAHTGFRV